MVTLLRRTSRLEHRTQLQILERLFSGRRELVDAEPLGACRLDVALPGEGVGQSFFASAIGRCERERAFREASGCERIAGDQCRAGDLESDARMQRIQASCVAQG